MAADRATLLLSGVLDLCVLSLLSAAPTYGYDIATRLNEQGLPAAPGSIYPLLARLERNGYVAAEELPSPSGPPRRWWSVTPAGRHELANGRRAWTSMSVAVDSMLSARPTRKVARS